MEAREYKTVDLEIHFNPGTHEYGEIKVLDSVEEGTGQSLDSINAGGSGIDEEPFYDSETILID